MAADEGTLTASASGCRTAGEPVTSIAVPCLILQSVAFASKRLHETIIDSTMIRTSHGEMLARGGVQ
jgi:hypothetical protein